MAAVADEDAELALQREIHTNEVQQAQLNAQMTRARALVAAAATKRQKTAMDALQHEENDARALLQYKEAASWARLTDGVEPGKASPPPASSSPQPSTSAPMVDIVELTRHESQLRANLEEAQESATTTLIAQRDAVVASLQLAKQRLSSASAQLFDFAELTQLESKLRANLEEAQELANNTLIAQRNATTDIVASLQLATKRMVDVSALQRLMEEEASARTEIINSTCQELLLATTQLGRNVGIDVVRIAFLTVVTPEACVDTEERLRIAVDAEEMATRKALELGESAARKAQAAADAARDMIHRLLHGGGGDPTTPAEAEQFESEERAIIEGRALRGLNRLYTFELPADDDARERLFGEVEGYLARLATKTIRAFVDSLQRPQEIITSVKNAVASELPEGKRIGVQLLADVSAHGPPDRLRNQANAAKRTLFDLPRKIGAPEEQAVVMAVVVEQVWDRACVATHEATVDEKKAQQCQMPCIVA